MTSTSPAYHDHKPLSRIAFAELSGQYPIRRLGEAETGLLVGAGTVRSVTDVAAAAEAGAGFLVSPGFGAALVEAAGAAGLPILPGVATASEAMAAAAAGCRELKLFPAEPAGGRPLLKALAGPFPDLAFCPTGGVGRDNFRDYLALGNVFAVGGSWLAPPAAIAAGDWRRITALARETLG